MQQCPRVPLLVRFTLVPVCIAASAFGLLLVNAHSQALWQSQMPPDMQGWVFSVRRLIAQFTAPVSTALAGLLLVLVAGVGLLNPVLRQVEMPLAPTSVAGAEVSG